MKKYLFLIVIFIYIFCVIFSQSIGLLSAESYSLKIVALDNKYEYFYPEVGVYDGKYYLKDEKNKIDKIVKDSFLPPQNAQVLFKNGEFKVVAEKKGRQISPTFLAEQIHVALRDGQTKINAVYDYLYPEITKAYIDRCFNLRGEFTTYFTYSTPDRKSNVRLAASKIDGTILASGEEFSFNKVVGKRTEENGYKNAIIIKDGTFLEGVGGGVCQVSTTLYNAALLSGLEITEYHPHSLAVSYVDKSFDAMVTDGWADLKFINNTSGFIFIRAYCTDDSVTFKIQGIELEEKYFLESVIEEEINFEKEQIIDKNAKSSFIKTFGKKGYKSKGFIYKEKDGKKQKTLLRVDFYKPINQTEILPENT